MLKRSLRIPYRQRALTTNSKYKENWYAKTFPYEEAVLPDYFLKNPFFWKMKIRINPYTEPKNPYKLFTYRGS